MNDNNETPPIVVNDSPLPDQLWAGVRQIAPAITAFALGKGWLDNETATLQAAVIGIVWPIVAGQMKTRRRAKQLANLGRDARCADAIITTKATGA